MNGLFFVLFSEASWADFDYFLFFSSSNRLPISPLPMGRRAWVGLPIKLWWKSLALLSLFLRIRTGRVWLGCRIMNSYDMFELVSFILEGSRLQHRSLNWAGMIDEKEWAFWNTMWNIPNVCNAKHVLCCLGLEEGQTAPLLIWGPPVRLKKLEFEGPGAAGGFCLVGLVP